jgi:hypothetical protein
MAVKHPLSESIFSLLSVEMHLAILEHLPHDSLAKIARTCTHFHNITIPLIYHTIDLSSHNSGRQLGQIRPCLQDTLRTQQYLFTQQIFSKPEYGHYVTSLTWTTHRNLYGDYKPGGAKKTLSDTLDLFAMLKEVTYLDLGSHRELEFRWHYQRIPALFPKAKQIVLNGDKAPHYSLSILHCVWQKDYISLRSSVASMESHRTLVVQASGVNMTHNLE